MHRLDKYQEENAFKQMNSLITNFSILIHHVIVIENTNWFILSRPSFQLARQIRY